jgi:formylglycine-generating enzyme required for sulfatase activity
MIMSHHRIRFHANTSGPLPYLTFLFVAMGIGALLLAWPQVVSAQGAGARVENLSGEQDGQESVLTYDLVGEGPGARDEVIMEISLDNGKTWDTPKGLSGDVGKGLRAGKGKRIRWNVLEEFPQGMDVDVRFRVQTASERDRRGSKEPWKDPDTGMEFVWVPGGCFEMGQTEEEKAYLIREAGEEDYKKYYKDELPRHRVCVDGFWMGKCEVTRGQFRRFVTDTGYRTDAEKQGKAYVFNKETEWKWKELDGYDWKNVGYSQDDAHPAACVSWNDARAFAEWLSGKSGRKMRLPTEAEWEYAARGGTTGMRFWGSDDSDACRYANVADKGHNWSNAFPCDDGYEFTAPAGHYQPNPFGLYDLLGNVWEWCEDRYGSDYYARSPEKNPKGPSGGGLRVLRGGSWFNYPWGVRCAYRLWDLPDSRLSNYGFRLVAVPPQ